MYKLHRNQRYILNQFSPVVRETLFEKFGLGISLIILEHLPDTAQRRRFRNINNLLSDSHFITMYWYFEFPQHFPYPHHFMVKRLAKHFVIQWFQILVELEPNLFIKDSYLEVIEWLRWKRHTRMLVIHNSYIVLENNRMPIFQRHLNLFL